MSLQSVSPAPLKGNPCFPPGFLQEAPQQEGNPHRSEHPSFTQPGLAFC